MGLFQTFCKRYPTMKEQVLPVEFPDSVSMGMRRKLRQGNGIT